MRFAIGLLLLLLAACSAGTDVDSPTPPTALAVTQTPGGRSTGTVRTSTSTLPQNTKTRPAPTRTTAPTLTRIPPTLITAPPTTALDPKLSVLQNVAQLVYTRFNQERAAVGAPPLVADPVLETLATLRSQDMLTRNYFGHSDPNTRTNLITPLMDRYHVQANHWGENIVASEGEAFDAQTLADEFAKLWLNSPTHRENILDPAFHHTGLGFAASADGGHVIATQVFTD